MRFSRFLRFLRFLRLLVRLLVRLLGLLPALVVVLLVRVLRPLWWVRFGVLPSTRMGHLGGNTEIYLCEKAAGLHPGGLFGGWDVWGHFGKPCNKQLARMIGRSLWVDMTGFVLLCFTVNAAFTGWEKHMVQPEQHDRDVHNLLERTPRQLRFSESELAFGRQECKRLGIAPPWVCLIVRDGAYLAHPAFSYHKHRDTDIADYRKAAVELAERGYTVLRMGAVVEKPFDVRHPHVVDYATNGMRSDFMDVYLAAHCAFAVSTGTGLDAVSLVFRRPVCYVNFIPLGYLNTWVRGLAIWQHHYKVDGDVWREMTPREIYDSGAGEFMRAEQFEAAGIRLEHNTPEEIKEACIEMSEHTKMHFIRLYEECQDKFWREFPTGTISPYNNKPLHGKVRSRIGNEFLRHVEQ